MKIELRDFQEAALDALVGNLKNARTQVLDGGSEQALVLAAPTGSGKTVIMAALVDAVFGGHPAGIAHDAFPDEHASCVWITDQPELNTQTYNRMISYLETARARQLEVIEEESFDQEILSTCILYFVNTQKLGKGGLLVRGTDTREYTFWDTMRNTIERRPSSVYVIIDEAHRGMAQSSRTLKEAESIVQRFIASYRENGTIQMPKVPIIIGVSATPKRFNDLLSNTDRNMTTYRVPAAKVRQSGLLKETIRLWRSSTQSGTEMTLLREAAEQFDHFERAWAAHDQTRPDDARGAVRPIMLVQVEDASRSGRGRVHSNSDLGEAIAAVSEALDVGPADASRVFAHAFQEDTPLELGSITVRRLAPAEIDDDPDVRVVFFKTALNTGWDCPRAEVMMSFRPAKDATSIAQLVGRMVRAPLQRRVEGPNSVLLNGVDLYLPRYDESALDDVVKRLTDDESETRVPTRIVRESVDLKLNEAIPEASECAELLGELVTYDLRRRRAMSAISRLMAIARRLERRTGLEPVLQDASETATKTITNWVLELLGELSDRSDEKFTRALEAAGRVEMISQDVDTWAVISPREGTAVRSLQENTRAVVDRDLRQRIDRADREVGEGLASALVKELANRLKDAGADLKDATRQARLQILAVLDQSLDVASGIEKQAAALIEKWREELVNRIAAVSDAERNELNELMSPAETSAVPHNVPQEVPERILRAKEKSDACWDKHLYVERDGQYRAALNSWEQAVIEQEIGDDDVVAWLRNLRGDQWRLAIPYDLDDQANLMYPDFIVFRRSKGALVADIVDPHGLHFRDAVAKAHGLAKYAETQRSTRVGRVEAVAVVDGAMRRRDLADPAARDILQQCRSGTDLQLWLKGDDRAPGSGVTYQASASRADTGDVSGVGDYAADYI